MSSEEELFAGLDVGAVAHHEMYTSWIRAGFTPEQAMDLMKVVVAELLRRISSE